MQGTECHHLAFRAKQIDFVPPDDAKRIENIPVNAMGELMPEGDQ